RERSTPLATFLYEQWRGSDLSQRAFAARYGLHLDTFTWLLEGNAPGPASREKLRAAFPEAPGLGPPRFGADVRALLAVRGWSLRRLSLEVGLYEKALSDQLKAGRVPEPEVV